ncbi:MAG: hypothetical protein ACJ72O_17760 [Marmoricola sp.]
MTAKEPPFTADDFPEFSEPPRHKPAPTHHSLQKPEPEPEDNEAQAAADDVIARLRRERAEGKQS